MELERFVGRTLRRHAALALGLSLALYFFVQLEIVLGVLYGSALGMSNAVILARRVRAVVDLEARKAKRAIQRNMLIRFTLISVGLAAGLQLLHLHIVAMIVGFSLFQLIASIDSYREVAVES